MAIAAIRACAAAENGGGCGGGGSAKGVGGVGVVGGPWGGEGDVEADAHQRLELVLPRSRLGGVEERVEERGWMNHGRGCPRDGRVWEKGADWELTTSIERLLSISKASKSSSISLSVIILPCHPELF